MPPSTYLGIDVGTTGVKVALVTADGGVRRLEVIPHATAHPQPGWAEQDADFYWGALCEVSRRLKEQAGPLWRQILAVTVTCIRDTCVCLDISGRPLRPAILWLDKREAHGMPRIPAPAKAAFLAVGMYDSVKLQRRASACNRSTDAIANGSFNRFSAIRTR